MKQKKVISMLYTSKMSHTVKNLRTSKLESFSIAHSKKVIWMFVLRVYIYIIQSYYNNIIKMYIILKSLVYETSIR